MWRVTCTAVLLAGCALAGAGDVLFTDGPQNYEGRNYYWLAEWKLTVTLPADVVAGDRLELLLGTKGSGKRTLFVDIGGHPLPCAFAGKKAYEWVPLPLRGWTAGKV